jgi:hypothetical protein
MGFFRQARRRSLCGAAGHLIRNPQLQGMQMERHDAGGGISRAARMGDPPQPAPHHHMPRRADLRTGVDIPEHKQRPRGVAVITRSQGALMNRQRR